MWFPGGLPVGHNGAVGLQLAGQLTQGHRSLLLDTLLNSREDLNQVFKKISDARRHRYRQRG